MLLGLDPCCTASVVRMLCNRDLSVPVSCCRVYTHVIEILCKVLQAALCQQYPAKSRHVLAVHSTISAQGLSPTIQVDIMLPTVR